MSSFVKLKPHVGHSLQAVTYGTNWNVSIECTDCNEVLVDFDNDKDTE